MVTMISWAGTEMYVAEDRVDEYLATGCTLAAVPAKKAETVKDQPKKKTTAAKKTVKK